MSIRLKGRLCLCLADRSNSILWAESYVSALSPKYTPSTRIDPRQLDARADGRQARSTIARRLVRVAAARGETRARVPVRDGARDGGRRRARESRGGRIRARARVRAVRHADGERGRDDDGDGDDDDDEGWWIFRFGGVERVRRVDGDADVETKDERWDGGEREGGGRVRDAVRARVGGGVGDGEERRDGGRRGARAAAARATDGVADADEDDEDAARASEKITAGAEHDVRVHAVERGHEIRRVAAGGDG